MISIIILTVSIEIFLRNKGYGTPPLYVFDPQIGYCIKSNQDVGRIGGSRVFINSLGMRSTEIPRSKIEGTFRVLVLGDSVPYGGSYIDQEDIFCSVAQVNLQRDNENWEILNAGVNAYGPQNVLRYVESKGLFDADLVIVYLPWGDLYRDFANFYIVPFWSNSSGYALEECFRHAVWACFGMLASRWKSTAAFNADRALDINISALERVQAICQDSGVPVYFFWSPCQSVGHGKLAEPDKNELKLVSERLPKECTVFVEELFQNRSDIKELYVDACHYSTKGHRIVGQYLAEFIRNCK
jgi:hypothetical protein